MELERVIEAVLFSADRVLTAAELRDVLRRAAGADPRNGAGRFDQVSVKEVENALRGLAAGYEASPHGFRLVKVVGGWRFASRPEFAPWIRALVGDKKRPTRLSHAALETLAIIAYRQPITRVEAERIRGVSVDGVLQTLLDRDLVTQTGRAEVPGRPMTYGTTRAFLEYFGLPDLGELPEVDDLKVIQRNGRSRTGELGLEGGGSGQELPSLGGATRGREGPAAGGNGNGDLQFETQGLESCPDPKGSQGTASLPALPGAGAPSGAVSPAEPPA